MVCSQVVEVPPKDVRVQVRMAAGQGQDPEESARLGIMTPKPGWILRLGHQARVEALNPAWSHDSTGSDPVLSSCDDNVIITSQDNRAKYNTAEFLLRV